MARFPDGTILMYKPDYKSVSVEVTTKKLIKCKSCIFSTIKDVQIADDAYIGGATICNKWEQCVNPEGYCYMAVDKDECDGR